MKIITVLILICSNLALTPQSAVGQTLVGHIVYWTDADTVQFRAASGKYYRVRLRGIDTPELRQTYGRECRGILRDETQTKTVTAELAGRDYYSRSIAKLSTVGIADLSLFLIEQGCAWEYSAPLSVKSAYQNAEQDARAAQIGLWQETCPTPPWVFRSSGYYSPQDCQP